MKKLHWYNKLFYVILFWILLLSITPLVIVSYLSYDSSSSQMHKYSITELKASSTVYKSFINNWFDFRFKEITAQSQESISSSRVDILSQNFEKSRLGLSKYVKSYDYTKSIVDFDESYRTIMLTYGYILDIYLLDKKGNLLYSVNREKDLGTNFFDGIYAGTKFANAYQKTLKDRSSYYSDLEFYTPLDGQLSSFIMAPIMNEEGNVRGVIAYRIKLDTIEKLFQDAHEGDIGLNYYIIGSDNTLRTKFDTDDDVLKRVIQNGVLSKNTFDEIQSYTNDNRVDVMAYTTKLHLNGVEWILIGEHSVEVMLEDSVLLARDIFGVMLLTILVILISAFYIAARLVAPMVLLSKASSEIVDGKDVEDVAITEFNELGQLAHSFNIMKNVQKKNESLMKEALLELKEQKMALDSHAIVGITDIKGKILYANDKFCEISGYSQSELIGQDHRVVNSGVYSSEFWKDMYKTVSSGKTWAENAICNRAKDGQLYWVDTTIVPFVDKKGNIKSYVSIRTDVTQNILDRKALHLAKQEAEEAVKAKSSFLASMSHEIRTPMNGVIGMLGLVKQTELNENQTHKIDVALSSANSLLSIINDILDFSKLEADKIELDSTEFDLVKEMLNLMEARETTLKSDDVKLVLDTSKLTQNNFKADIGRIKQIINNIVGNAIKFTKRGEVKLLISSKIKDDKKISLCFEVEDSGIGIPHDKIATLFDSFSQVDISTTRKYGGTGLGLTISKRLVEMMGGNINVISELDRGTTFSFCIDVSTVETSKREDEVVESSNEYDLDLLNDKRVLLVDDNLTNQLVAEGMIENINENIIIDVAKNGQEAVNILQNNPQKYSLVFMDCQMPIMDGFEATEVIRASGNTISIVAMTANAMEGDKEKCIAFGMNDYLSKPLDASKLKAALSKWIQ